MNPTMTRRSHPMNLSRARVQGHRGFTLLELMIAVLVGSIVIMGVYTLYSVSINGYRIQDQTLQALGQLRSASNQLKADLRSAAFNAPAQSNAEAWVETRGTTVLTAVAIQDDSSVPVANIGENDNILPQEIRLLGDYESQKLFQTVQVQGTKVTLNWNVTEDGDKDEFERVFTPDNMVRIELYGQLRHEIVIPIASNSWNGGVQPEITLTDAVPGVYGIGTGNELNVVSFLRYRLQNDTRRDSNSVKYDLIRERLDPQGHAIPGTWLIVAEYIVDLQFYDICLNVATPAPGSMEQVPVQIECYATLADLQAAGYSLAPDSSNESHLLRSLKFKVAARTPFEDPDMPFLARNDRDEPLRTFELDTSLVGSARVFEAVHSVFMTSIQARRQ